MSEWLIGALGAAPVWAFLGYCLGGAIALSSKPEDHDSYFR